MRLSGRKFWNSFKRWSWVLNSMLWEKKSKTFKKSSLDYTMKLKKLDSLKSMKKSKSMLKKSKPPKIGSTEKKPLEISPNKSRNGRLTLRNMRHNWKIWLNSEKRRNQSYKNWTKILKWNKENFQEKRSKLLWRKINTKWISKKRQSVCSINSFLFR